MKKRELILYLAGDVVNAARAGFTLFQTVLTTEIIETIENYREAHRPKPQGPLEVRNPIGEWTPNYTTGVSSKDERLDCTPDELPDYTLDDPTDRRRGPWRHPS